MRKTTDDEKKLLTRIFASLTDKELYPPSFDEIGAANPKSAIDTGYKGRAGVREAIFMDDELAKFLRDKPTASEIEKHVARQGFLTMAQDGAWKALRGETTLEEVLRMVDVPQE
jgi:type II secretory ATPase GspE/PulE/Tfp pilus assembly ATPase PilB-like protein